MISADRMGEDQHWLFRHSLESVVQPGIVAMGEWHVLSHLVVGGNAIRQSLTERLRRLEPFRNFDLVKHGAIQAGADSRRRPKRQRASNWIVSCRMTEDRLCRVVRPTSSLLSISMRMCCAIFLGEPVNAPQQTRLAK